MKILLVTFLAVFSTSAVWLGNFSEAQKEAKANHKLILINFSGSDWCIPCMRLRTEILESKVFEDYAKEHLVLVRADFPRQKKNQLSKEQVKLNESLADKYNKDGKFPYTLLVDENGKVVKSWDGFPNESADALVQEVLSVSK